MTIFALHPGSFDLQMIFAHRPDWVTSAFWAGKNSKEQYIKRLQMCMKNYDYKDEQKDVKGKVSMKTQRSEAQEGDKNEVC